MTSSTRVASRHDMKRQYHDGIKLLYTDTDSLILNIYTEDICVMLSQKDLYDLSEYPEAFKTQRGDQVFNSANKKVLGKMKDEKAGDIITEFIGLRSKSYFMK